MIFPGELGTNQAGCREQSHCGETVFQLTTVSRRPQRLPVVRQNRARISAVTASGLPNATL